MDGVSVAICVDEYELHLFSATLDIVCFSSHSVRFSRKNFETVKHKSNKEGAKKKMFRVESHIVSAVCIARNAATSNRLQQFYTQLFSPSSSGPLVTQPADLVITNEAAITAIEAAQKSKRELLACWLPTVAVSKRRLDAALAAKTLIQCAPRIDEVGSIRRKSGLHPESYSRVLPVLTNAANCSGVSVAFGVSVLSEQDSQDAKNDPFKYSAIYAPFPAQRSSICGVVNWSDILLTPKVMSERSSSSSSRHDAGRQVAKALYDAFGWRMSLPITIPDDGTEYATLLNATPDKGQNRHKLTGLMFNRYASKTNLETLSIPFFSCGSEELVRSRVAAVEATGGKVLLPPFFADGWCAKVSAPESEEVFGLYCRVDEWDAVKPTTKLVDPSEVMTISGFSFPAAKK